MSDSFPRPGDGPDPDSSRRSLEWAIRLENIRYQCEEMRRSVLSAQYADVRDQDLQRFMVALDGLLPGLPVLLYDDRGRDLGAMVQSAAWLNEAEFVRMRVADYSGLQWSPDPLMEPLRTASGLRSLYLFLDDAEDLLHCTTQVAKFLIQVRESYQVNALEPLSFLVRPIFCYRGSYAGAASTVEADLFACFYHVDLKP